jgi:phosphoribosyl 1,2-cyclic phosphodiesterase
LLLNGFDVRISKVGQANFVLLTHKERALVVDCDVSGGYKRVLQPAGGHSNEIMLALAGVIQLGVVITHNHKDHYNGVRQFRKIIDVINTQRQSDRDLELTNLPDMEVGDL